MAHSTASEAVVSQQDVAPEKPLRVAFVVGAFPLVSETFLIDQVAQLVDLGVAVEVFAFDRGDESNVSQLYFTHELGSRVRYLEYPLGKLSRVAGAPRRALRLARRHPRALLRALDVFRYGHWALSLKLLYWVETLAGKEFDVIHCHFGTVARDFVAARDAAGLAETPLVTTFYGVDVSRVFLHEAPDFYDDLKRACSRYFVMSEDMRRRVIARGFPADRVLVHPVGVDVERHTFRQRMLDGQELRLVAVGRFVEKKGFDDLIRALALVRERSPRPVRCVIVGGGPLDDELRGLRDSLGLQDVVEFAGFLPVEQVIELFDRSHVLVAPSKTASDGDME